MRRSDKDGSAIAGKLSAIADVSREGLIECWEAAHGRPPPKGISRRLLEYSAAYAVQVKGFGGLKPSVRRQLERVTGKNDPSVQKKARSTSKLSRGARLVRDWHGHTHTVDVVEGGFRYEGRDFKSLSHIAREITGARWSGPRFFGL